MNKTKVLVVFGTRPEAIKLFPVIAALKSEASLDCRVCVTGQHRHILDQILQPSGIVPDIDLDIMTAGQSLDGLTVTLLAQLGQVYDQEKPDRVVVQGDTATAMVAALAAYYRKIPVSHVEAGLRSGNIHHPWPEEVNRKIVATIADQHFAPTSNSADALRAENISENSIYVTGNTVIDALLATQRQLQAEPSLGGTIDAIAATFCGARIVGMTTHRRENFEAMRGIARAIGRLVERDNVRVIFPMHPNPNVRQAMAEALPSTNRIALIEPLDYHNFVRLLQISDLMLTDSGGVQEEAPTFGKPVLVMRETTERPEGVAAGTAKLVGTDPDTIVSEVFHLLDDAPAYAAMSHAHSPFGDGNAAARIARIIVNGA